MSRIATRSPSPYGGGAEPRLPAKLPRGALGAGAGLWLGPAGLVGFALRLGSLGARSALRLGLGAGRPNGLPRWRRLVKGPLARGQVGRRDCLGEMLADLAGRDLFHRPRLEVGQREGTVGDADQPVDGQAQRLEHASHLAVLPLRQG